MIMVVLSEFLWARQARARLLLVAAWAKGCTLSVVAAAEEPTTWLRSVARLVVTVKPLEFGALVGRTRT